MAVEDGLDLSAAFVLKNVRFLSGLPRQARQD
jgi:hypothetical protein